MNKKIAYRLLRLAKNMMADDTKYRFKDGIFSFWVAEYGSWAGDREIVFRVREDSEAKRRAKEKGIVGYDRLISVAKMPLSKRSRYVKAWLNSHRSYKLLGNVEDEGKIYPFESKLMEKAVEKSNGNGGDIQNDGESYILCTFDGMNNSITVMKSKSRSDSRNLVQYYKNDSDVALIIVQKGRDAIAHHRTEFGWESRRP